MDKVKATFYLKLETVEILRNISFLSRRSKSELVDEGIMLVSKIPPGEKQ